MQKHRDVTVRAQCTIVGPEMGTNPNPWDDTLLRTLGFLILTESKSNDVLGAKNILISILQAFQGFPGKIRIWPRKMSLGEEWFNAND